MSCLVYPTFYFIFILWFVLFSEEPIDQETKLTLLIPSLDDIPSFDNGGSGFDDSILSDPISEAPSSNDYQLDHCIGSPLSNGSHVVIEGQKVSIIREAKREFMPYIVKDEPKPANSFVSGQDISLNENVKLEKETRPVMAGIDETNALFGDGTCADDLDWDTDDTEEFNCNAANFVDSSDDDVILVEEKRSVKKPDRKSSEFVCNHDNCCKTFRSKMGLRLHQRRHSGKYPFICETCGCGFSARSQLFEHARTHTGKYPKCKICGVAPKTAQGRRIHAAKHGSERYECKTCKKEFPCTDYLRRHEKTHVRSFTCSVCSKIFYAKHHVKEHERIHYDPSYHCDQCDFKTTFKQSLNRHVKARHGEHDDNRERLCARCGRCFSSESQFKRHSGRCKLTKDIWSQEDGPEESGTRWFGTSWLNDFV